MIYELKSDSAATVMHTKMLDNYGSNLASVNQGNT